MITQNSTRFLTLCARFYPPGLWHSSVPNDVTSCRLCGDFCTCHWTQGSRTQILQKIWILRAIEISSTLSFGWDVKPEIHVERFYGIKNNFQLWNNTSKGKFHHSLRPFPCLIPDDTAVRFAWELWSTNQEFPSVDIVPVQDGVRVPDESWLEARHDPDTLASSPDRYKGR
jgi:hypothetical protein